METRRQKIGLDRINDTLSTGTYTNISYTSRISHGQRTFMMHKKIYRIHSMNHLSVY